MRKEKDPDKGKSERKPLYFRAPDQVREDFLDICWSLDMDQVDAFAQIVRFYKEEMDVKFRPSRVRK
jgi:hypothetical protein